MTFQPLGIGTGSLIAQRYEIARQLGAGAMSAVYVVRDRELGKQEYALKILQGPAAENASDVERFRQEVVLTRKLTHENIVRTFEFGTISSSQYFMVMELVDGRTLEQLVHSRGELSFDKIVEYLCQIAEALTYAHQAGIVHRDLKPANILVSNDGMVKVADFGLAFHCELRMHLTQPGQTVGTPAYMAPERLSGEETDPRSDIYSFGILAYELITGTCPFNARDWYQLAQQVTSNSVPLLRKSAGVPAWYDELIQRATAKSADDRFQSAEDLHDFLLSKRGSAGSVVLRGSGKRSKGRHSGNAPSWMIALASRPSVMAVVIAALLLMVAGTYLKPGKSVETVAENVNQGAQMLDNFANSLEKLNRVVKTTYENQDKINSVLEQMEQESEVEKAAIAAQVSEGTEPAGKLDHEIQPQPAVANPNTIKTKAKVPAASIPGTSDAPGK